MVRMRFTGLLTVVLVVLALILGEAGAAKKKRGTKRPFLQEDQAVEEDQVGKEDAVKKACERVLEALADPALFGLFSSFFPADSPAPEMVLPTGEHRTGLPAIDDLPAEARDMGVKNYTLGSVSPLVVVDDTCHFFRVARWHQDGCRFAQPGTVSVRFRLSQVPGMGLVVSSWREHWSPTALAAQYVRCDERWAKIGKVRPTRLRQQRSPPIDIQMDEGSADGDEAPQRTIHVRRDGDASDSDDDDDYDYDDDDDDDDISDRRTPKWSEPKLVKPIVHDDL